MSYLCSQLLKTICPCFFNNKKRDLSSYGDHEQIQKQQFINQDSLQNQYNIKHAFTSDTKSSKLSNRNVQQNSIQNISVQQSSSKQQQEIQKVYKIQQTKYESYLDMIDPLHPYYQILVPKIQSLPSIFSIDEKYMLQLASCPFPLKMYCKQSQVRKTNIFIYSFQFPSISHQSYQELLNNFNLQKSFDPNIDQFYKKVESPNNDTKVIYLSYYKVLIVAPRDFVYVRYLFKKGHQNWSICTSVTNQQQVQGKTRGQIVLTATKVVQTQQGISVQVYSEVNMKMSIKPQMAKNRGKTQIKKYLQKCYKYLTQNKNQSIL